MVCNKFFDQLGIPHQASKGIIVLIFYAICVAFYMTEEKWDLLKCIYFVTVTITTIGYGDVTPTKDETKIFTIFVIIIGIFVITGYIADVVGNAIKDVFNWCLKLIFPKDSERDDGLEGPSHYIAKVVLICVLLLNLIFVAVIFLMVEADESFVDSLYWVRFAHFISSHSIISYHMVSYPFCLFINAKLFVSSFIHSFTGNCVYNLSRLWRYLVGVRC